MFKGEFKGGLLEEKLFDAAMMRNALKLIVLMHLKKGGLYPYALLKHFRNSPHPMLSCMKKSDIYNTINSLENEGFVNYRIVKKGAQTQKSYRLTPKGKKVIRISKGIAVNALKDLKKLIKSEFE